MTGVDGVGASLQGVNDYWMEMDAEAIERGDHRAFVGGMWEELGLLQMEFLRLQGLQPHHRILDLGCGALRGGIHLAAYVDPGNYCGLDANESLIEAGMIEIERANLTDRGIRLIADAEFGVQRFAEEFDYVLALSLFTHLPLAWIEQALAQVASVLASGGRLFASVFEASAPGLDLVVHQPAGTTTFVDRDPFHHTFAELSDAADRHGLSTRLIGDFGHPRGQRMVEFLLST